MAGLDSAQREANKVQVNERKASGNGQALTAQKLATTPASACRSHSSVKKSPYSKIPMVAFTKAGGQEGRCLAVPHRFRITLRTSASILRCKLRSWLTETSGASAVKTILAIITCWTPVTTRSDPYQIVGKTSPLVRFGGCLRIGKYRVFESTLRSNSSCCSYSRSVGFSAGDVGGRIFWTYSIRQLTFRQKATWQLARHASPFC